VKLFLVTLVAPGNPPIPVKGLMAAVDHYSIENRFRNLEKLKLSVKEISELRTLQEGHLVPLE
jgi:hypothetical protein